MSDSMYTAMSKALAQANDALRKTFSRDGAVCWLIARGEHTSEWVKVRELTSGFYAQYGDRDLREDIFLDVADVDEDFPDDWARATHVAYGVPDCENEVFVYAFASEQKDRTGPDGASPTYKAFLTRVPNERYKVD